MKKILKRSIIIAISVMLCMTLMVNLNMGDMYAEADESPTSGYNASYEITRINNVSASNMSTIFSGNRFDITFNIHTPITANTLESFTPKMASDNFSSSDAVYLHASGSDLLIVKFSNVEYHGDNKQITIQLNDGSDYIYVSTYISQCKSGAEVQSSISSSAQAAQSAAAAAQAAAAAAAQSSAASDKEVAIPQPRSIFSINDLGHEIEAGETFTITINVKNIGKTTIQEPIVTVETSDCLMLAGSQNVYELTDITKGASKSFTVKLKALKKITSPSQYVSCKMDFIYSDGLTKYTLYNVTNTGNVIIPSVVTDEEKEEEEETEISSPLPNLITTNFDYGSSSVAGGEEFILGVKLKNTSKTIDIENAVITVESDGFTPNGASNTFYFDYIKAGKTVTITLPMKAASLFSGNTENISLNASYEFVDQKKRSTSSSSQKISIPVYQKDRFEIDAPVVPAICYEGEEISIQMNYVNKGKSAANNVATELSGDISSPNMYQNIGNIEAGKNGQFAFAITPNMSGQCYFEIKVTYEDANENLKERVFPVTLNVEAMSYEDPGTWEDPGMYEEPQQEGGAKKWLIIGGIILAGFIAFIVVRKKIRKKKAAKTEENQWKVWEEELAKEDALNAANEGIKK